jgi:hypothetical protein
MATKVEVERLAVLETQMIETNKRLEKMETTLEKLPENLIAALDQRYAKIHEVEEIKETVAPLTSFRRKLWTAIIFSLLSIATVTVILWEIQRFKGLE